MTTLLIFNFFSLSNREIYRISLKSLFHFIPCASLFSNKLYYIWIYEGKKKVGKGKLVSLMACGVCCLEENERIEN